MKKITTIFILSATIFSLVLGIPALAVAQTAVKKAAVAIKKTAPVVKNTAVKKSVKKTAKIVWKWSPSSAAKTVSISGKQPPTGYMEKLNQAQVNRQRALAKGKSRAEADAIYDAEIAEAQALLNQ